jgi:hypothetical protein
MPEWSGKEMEKSLEDLEEEWDNGDQKRKIELNFQIWFECVDIKDVLYRAYNSDDLMDS